MIYGRLIALGGMLAGLGLGGVVAPGCDTVKAPGSVGADPLPVQLYSKIAVLEGLNADDSGGRSRE